MTTAITADNRVERRDGAGGDCPHCGASGTLAVSASPAFGRLRAERPAQVGLVFQCTACRTPVFQRYRTLAFRDDRIELEALPAEPESGAERFSLAYLPVPVAARFREALACYSHGLWQAFAAMCRETARAVREDVGEAGRLRLFDQAREVQALAEIDEATFAAVRRVLFEDAPGRVQAEPALSRRESAALLETLKDLLAQTYVRRARLRQALKVRHFFAEQSGQAAGGAPVPRTRSGSGF